MSEYGRAPSGQALAASGQAPVDLDPSGFDPSRGYFTIAELLAWAKTKPAGEVYHYADPGNCALGQFAREMRGFSSREAAREDYSPHLSDDLRAAAQGIYARWPNDDQQTFGALVRRLETLAPETIVPPSEWVKLDTYMNDLVMSV